MDDIFENDLNIGHESSKLQLPGVLKRDLNASDEDETPSSMNSWSDENTTSCASFCGDTTTTSNNSNRSNNLSETTNFKTFNKCLASDGSSDFVAGNNLGDNPAEEGKYFFTSSNLGNKRCRRFDDEHDERSTSRDPSMSKNVELYYYYGHHHGEQQQQTAADSSVTREVHAQPVCPTTNNTGGGTPRTLRVYESFVCADDSDDDESFESVTSPRMFVFRNTGLIARCEPTGSPPTL
jgi:hypothetical protein